MDRIIFVIQIEAVGNVRRIVAISGVLFESLSTFQAQFIVYSRIATVSNIDSLLSKQIVATGRTVHFFLQPKQHLCIVLAQI